MFKSEKQAIIKTCDLNNTNEHLSLQIKVLSATNYHISWADFRGKPRVWADHLAALYSQIVPRLIFHLRLPKATYRIWHNTKIHQLQRNSSTAGGTGSAVAHFPDLVDMADRYPVRWAWRCLLNRQCIVRVGVSNHNSGVVEPHPPALPLMIAEDVW